MAARPKPAAHGRVTPSPQPTRAAAGGVDLAGGLYLVPTPIGNLGDLTPRAIQVLIQADCIACEDTRRTGLLLHLVGLPRKQLVCMEAHREGQRIDEILARLAQGQRVALVSDGGTPCLSDPGQRLVAAVAAAERSVVSLPGASAITAAYAASGFPPPWTFYGFIARKGKARREVFDRIATRADEGAVLMESPFRLTALLKELAEDVRYAERPLVLAQEISKIHETYHRGTAAALWVRFRERAQVKGEWTVLVGPNRAGDAVESTAAESADADRSGNASPAGHE